jgi:Sortase domain
MAALLVVLTLGYGVVVGVLLSPRSGTVWDTVRWMGLAPTQVGAPSDGDRPAESGPPVPDERMPGPTAAVARVPGGPTPLPAEAAPLPVGLSIPAIGVDEPTLVPLGREPDGSMQVPEDFARAGWFTGGPTPGTSGPAVIAGHVDSFRGPAVFFRLRELKPGDVVTVLLDNGTRARFVVDGVFGPVPGVALRLITCGGSFDRVARSYRSNVVVYASQRNPAS